MASGRAFRSLISKAKPSACLAFLLLLPLPVVAYTIAPWTFMNGSNFALSDTISADHKALTYSGATGSGASQSSGVSTVTASAGETLSAQLKLSGLKIRAGTLTVSITVGSTTVTQTFSGNNPTGNFGPIALAAGSQSIQVSFQFSDAAIWNYTASTKNNLVFR